MAHRNRWFTVLNSMVDLSMAMLNNQMAIQCEFPTMGLYIYILDNTNIVLYKMYIYIIMYLWEIKTIYTYMMGYIYIYM